MPEYQEKSKIIQIENLAEGIFRLTLHAPKIAGASHPGQFAMVKVSSHLDPLLRRPFSIYSTSSRGDVQILFKVVGKGTALMAGMEAGSWVDVIGPLGRGFFFEKEGVACLVGGGMGIAPLNYLARKMLQSNQSVLQYQVLLGARTRKELCPLADEFLDMGFILHSATDDGTMGHHGLVPELLPEVLSEVDRVYACGPWPMMRSVAQLCLQAGVFCQVSLETHMACGLGACLGCTLHGVDSQYIHVCKHGPVFNAGEVRWDQ